MNDLISRQAVIDEIKDVYKWHDVVTEDRLIQHMKNLPSAQPERKRGKWIRENIVLTSNPPQFQWHCSECGRLVHWFSAEILTDFCPNCGAEMENDD